MEGTILCSRFMVKKKLGAGSFGEIFSAEDLVAHKIVAIKLESLKIRSPQLEYEARIYQIMSEGSGIPRLYFFGADQKHNVMAIDLLGKSLEDLFAHHKKPLSLKTVLMLADQMIDSIRYLHRRHFIHRDIKPDNFVMGLNQRGSFMSITCSTGNTTKNIKSINNGFHAFVENPTIEENKKSFNEENKKNHNEENKKNHNEENKKNHNEENKKNYNEENNLPENENMNSTHPNSNTTTNHPCNNNFIISKVTSMNGSSNNANKVFMIDFGLAKRYRDPKTHSHIPFAENKSLTGTARYASINAMRGKEQSRRDDLESLGYVLIYLLKGKLPWQGLPARDQHQKMKKIADVKRNTPVEVLCDGLPHQFIEYLNSVKSLKFEEEPDYAFYKALFRDLFIKEGYVYDYQYDWIISNERREKLNSDKPPEIHKSNIKFIVQPPSEEPSRVLKPFSRRYGHIRRSADKGEKLFIEPNNNKNIHDNNHNNNANNNELSGNINNNNNSNNVNMNAVVQSARTDKNAPIVAPPRMRTALPCPRLPSLPNLTPRINRPQVAPRHYQSRRVLPVGE